MNDINELFFELIRMSIGTQTCLSRTPSAAEWGKLYDMAKKQSLVGVCFAGVQKMVEQQQAPKDMLYFTWLGMTAKIQQRNQIVDEQCVVLQRRLSSDGFRSCILKGQGVARVYPGHLRGLRQSGDIDIWIEGDRDQALGYFRKQGAKVSYTSIKHAQVEVFEDTECEVHSRPSWFYSPIHDRRWMKWVKEQEICQFGNAPINGIVAPTTEFNLVFLLIHIYRHLFEEGIGLRQIMDYYMALSTSANKIQVPEVTNELKALGLLRFAGALMFVLKKVFGLGEQYMICNPNEKDGRFLLDEIMQGGNFGKYDERNGKRKKNRIARGFATMKRNMRYISSYSSEILWAPIWKMWHWCWRKKHGYI